MLSPVDQAYIVGVAVGSLGTVLGFLAVMLFNKYVYIKD